MNDCTSPIGYFPWPTYSETCYEIPVGYCEHDGSPDSYVECDVRIGTVFNNDLLIWVCFEHDPKPDDRGVDCDGLYQFVMDTCED